MESSPPVSGGQRAAKPADQVALRLSPETANSPAQSSGKERGLSSLRTLTAGDWLRLLFWLILIVALLPRLADFVNHSIQVITWRYQVDYDEGLNLSAAWHLSQGQNIYANSVPDHFIAAPYPFLYFLINAIGIKIWGIQFQFGRIVTFASSIAIAALIGWAVWMVTRRQRIDRLDAGGASIVAGLLWFVVPPVYIWSTFYKQDMLAIAIALLAIVLVYRWQESRWLLLVAPIMALAFFAKQNELLASAVGCGYMLVRDWKRGLKLSIATALCIALPFIALNVITKNGYYNHIIGYQLVPWNFDDLIRKLSRIVADHPLLIAIALAYLVGCLVVLVRAFTGNSGLERWKAAHRVISGWLFPLYLVVATASLFTIGAYQGNYNLVLDFFPPLMIIIGAALAFLPARAAQVKDPGRQRLLVGATVLVALLYLGQVIDIYFTSPGTYTSFGSMPGKTRGEMLDGLEKQIAQAPGDILTEDVYLAFAAGRAVPYDNLYHMRLQSQEGKWDDSKFLQDLRDRRFALVLLDHGSRRWTDKGWETLNQNYELVFPDGIDLWRPRARPTAPQHSLQACILADNKGQGQATLDGWSIGPANLPLKAGQGLVLTTYWQGGTPFSGDYTLFAHLQSGSGEVVAQRDSAPVGIDGKPAPFTGWQSGQNLQLDQSFPLPANLAPGSYRLVVGAYRPAGTSLQHLQPACGSASGNDIVLGTIDISR
ncbi:MAG TPA: hypothetical protein VH186_25725 [Chloroflexia bacterium]|nr:hypothetical protein [Chloroflexia bacterium]